MPPALRRAATRGFTRGTLAMSTAVPVICSVRFAWSAGITRRSIKRRRPMRWRRASRNAGAAMARAARGSAGCFRAGPRLRAMIQPFEGAAASICGGRRAGSVCLQRARRRSLVPMSRRTGGRRSRCSRSNVTQSTLRGRASTSRTARRWCGAWRRRRIARPFIGRCARRPVPRRRSAVTGRWRARCKGCSERRAVNWARARAGE